MFYAIFCHSLLNVLLFFSLFWQHLMEVFFWLPVNDNQLSQILKSVLELALKISSLLSILFVRLHARLFNDEIQTEAWTHTMHLQCSKYLNKIGKKYKMNNLYRDLLTNKTCLLKTFYLYKFFLTKKQRYTLLKASTYQAF